jgi:hypothetical protein
VNNFHSHCNQMKSITVEDVIRARPCPSYPRSRIEKLWSDKKSLTPEEISILKIRTMDKIWVFLMCYLNQQQTKLFACSFLNYVLTLLKNPIPAYSNWLKKIQLCDFQALNVNRDNEITDEEELILIYSQVAKLKHADLRAKHFFHNAETKLESCLYFGIFDISYYYTDFEYSMSVYRTIEYILDKCPKGKVSIIRNKALALAIEYAEQE